MSDQKFELWATGGQGGAKVAEFDTLADALAEVKREEGSASFAIKYPKGQWHNWTTQEKTK